MIQFMLPTSYRLFFALIISVTPALADPSSGAEMRSSASWNDFRYDLFPENTVIADGSARFELEAPRRAVDPATVPVRIRQTDANSPLLSAILVIDENPSPVAAELSFGAALAPLDFSTRVRVNEYSNVRAIAKSDDGLFMHGKFVKAAGGCAAPAMSSSANVDLGEMRLRHFDAGDKGDATETRRREAQIMIRHPNFSGLQRDQVTHLYIGAHFINRLEVRQGDELLFSMEGGISISENPVFRFAYTDNGAEFITVKAEDTEGNVFERKLSKQSQT